MRLPWAALGLLAVIMLVCIGPLKASAFIGSVNDGTNHGAITHIRGPDAIAVTAALNVQCPQKEITGVIQTDEGCWVRLDDSCIGRTNGAAELPWYGPLADYVVIKNGVLMLPCWGSVNAATRLTDGGRIAESGMGRTANPLGKMLSAERNSLGNSSYASA